ncbi:MAG: hypothetical protein Q8K19_19740 [Methylicorpusculum sp.]|nr:hypothetical protein [Methylicorpusculum sp.]MDZ4152894.1 hypothetical protein [Methylicorpusculum sp.]
MPFNKKLLTAAGLVLSLTTLNAEAVLTPYIAVDGSAVVYSSISDITWTADANLLGTMISNQGYNTVVNAIIAASPIITNTPNDFSPTGSYNISVAEFSSSGWGLTSWFGAQAFTAYLNRINYAGSNQWALPSAFANPGGGDIHFGSQFGQLFYNELGGTAGMSIPNTANFVNEQAYLYWLGTDYASNPNVAGDFFTSNGNQTYGNKFNQVYVWAVSPGQLPAAVPVPGAIWLMGSSLLGLLLFTHKKKLKS